MLRLLISMLVACWAGFAQSQPDLVLAEGRQLVAELTLQQGADQILFQRIGFDGATALLTSVMNRGHATGATPQDWTGMHRALAGLIELNIAKGDLFRAAVLANFQDVYYRNDEGDFAAALAASRQSLDLLQRSGQTNTLYLSWKNIGENLMRLGRLDEALDALYQAHRSINDPTSPSGAIIWREIVDGEIARKNFASAQSESDAFLRQSEASAPALFRGRALLARANLEMETGHNDEALNDIRAADRAVAPDQDALSFHYECANELFSMMQGVIYSLPYPEAMALARRIDVEFPDLPIRVSAFARQAIDYRRRLAGDFDALLREDTAALETARQTKDIRSQIGLLRSLAVTYSFANATPQAITLLEEALDLERSALPPNGVVPDPISQYSYFSLLNGLGAAYAKINDIGKARRSFEEVAHAIDALSEGAAKTRFARLYAEAELGRALVAELDDEPDLARSILKKALDQGVAGPARFTRSTVFLQAARFERNLNELPLAAVRYYEDAILALHDEKDTRTEISARLQLARYLAVEGAQKVPEAQQRAAENLKLAEIAATAIEFADAQWRVKFIQGIVAENAKRTNEAIDLYKQAITKLDQLRAGLPQQEQRQAFMDEQSIQELYRRLLGLLTASGQPQQAWEYLERGKARAFLEMLQGRRFRGNSAAHTNGGLDDLEKQIVNLRARLAPGNASMFRGAGQEPALLDGALLDAESRFAVARQQSELASSRASHPLSLKPISFPLLQKSLPARSALIEYAVLDGALTAFIATGRAVNQIHWTASTKSLNIRIQQLRDLMASANSGAQLPPLLKEMSAVLVDPVVNALPLGIDRLLIVPSQALYYIPFQALLLPGGGAMIDRYTITYLPSASTLQFLKPKPARNTELFLGALGNVSVEGMPPLPGTLQETSGIRDVYPNAVRVTEAAFTHDRALRALTESDTAHFATHGQFEGNAPLFSAILTAPAPGQPSRLSLYEVMDLKLRARLVVLSACETNRGKLMGGDEIEGLTRTFLLAGADAVISSLWKVSDESTALLMQNFYRRVKAGKSRAMALRESGLEVRKQFPHPFFWAAFVETGID